MLVVKRFKEFLKLLVEFWSLTLLFGYFVAMFSVFGYIAWRDDWFSEYLATLTLGFLFVSLYVYVMYRLVIRLDEEDSV